MLGTASSAATDRQATSRVRDRSHVRSHGHRRPGHNAPLAQATRSMLRIVPGALAGAVPCEFGRGIAAAGHGEGRAPGHSAPLTRTRLKENALPYAPCLSRRPTRGKCTHGSGPAVDPVSEMKIHFPTRRVPLPRRPTRGKCICLGTGGLGTRLAGQPPPVGLRKFHDRYPGHTARPTYLPTPGHTLRVPGGRRAARRPGQRERSDDCSLRPSVAVR